MTEREKLIGHRDEIERLTPPFYIRWTSGPNYERAFLCVEDGEPDMNSFAEVSFGQARKFKAGIAALSQPKAGKVKGPVVAWRVHDFHVARQPVKARGKFPEPTEFLYPASREQDAKATAKLMGAECDPLGVIGAPPAMPGTVNTMNIVQRGFDAWAAKPHNAKWVRKIDGTPIPNDLVVCIAEAVRDALPATPFLAAPAVGWRLVPVDATDQMIEAALTVDWSNEDERGAAHNVWHAMIAAAAAPWRKRKP